MKEFEKYIIENHPDPDRLGADMSIFNDLVNLAENYASQYKKQQEEAEFCSPNITDNKIIDFAVYLTGHDEETIKKMLKDYENYI